MKRITERRGSAGRMWLPAFLAATMAAQTLAATIIPDRPALKLVATSPTAVSLTFDDATTDQQPALPILANYGMKGTFYVNSGRLNTSGYMTASQVQQVQAAGHEIGGHSINHLNLPTLNADEQRRQVCNDRIALQNLGLRVDHFAYPFGAYSGTTQQALRDCGYLSGRTVGGIGCGGCDVAETVPPEDAYAVRTPNSIKSNTSLATMQSYVTQAENGGGGWVPIVLHRICNDCETYSVSQETLSAFLAWLQPRAALGTTVRTVAQVLGGGSPPPPPPASDLQNPSLEADANSDQVPDCWQLGGFGTNTFTWSRTNDAHSGNFAERLQITSLSSGDRKLVTHQREPACAPSAQAGQTKTLRAWYKSDRPVYWVAYYQNSSGAWIWWAQSPALPANAAYVQAVWTTPAVPSGVTKLSFGLSLRQPGTVTMDDFSLVQT